GGARVSEKHAGFIVNSGEASAEDVKQLAEHIKKTVYKKHGILLECEIRFIGEI
ncbi:MAG: UDP-N-acetylenolpyruvoylglucosamine reductase, partial [Acutalibacteraceae bacterium]